MTLQQELRRVWMNYVVYAEACIQSNVFPAPFGATTDEKAVREKIREATKKPEPYTLLQE